MSIEKKNFLDYDSLPVEYEFDDKYYNKNEGTKTRFCWVFLGEITDDSNSKLSFHRNKTVVKDINSKDGIPIFFYLDNNIKLDTSKLKKKNIICIFYALIHYFMDGTIGIRIDNKNDFMIIETNFKDLDINEINKKGCLGCDKNPEKLKRCGVCKISQYCSEECQKISWNKNHKIKCKLYQRIIKEENNI
jgi:hypothetical protein